MRNSLIREKHVHSVHTIYFNEFAFLFCFLLFGTFRILNRQEQTLHKTMAVAVDERASVCLCVCIVSVKN